MKRATIAGRFVFGALTAAALLQISTPVFAESCHAHATAEPAAEPAKAAGGMKIPHVPVIDQDGRELDFYQDLVVGKVVVMNFVFTTCTTVCPPMGANFGKLQKLLGERAGRDVHLISVSIDPATDTPERMRAWGAKFGAGPGWTLVTGSKTDLTRLLKDLEVFSPDTNAHSPTVLIGDDSHGRWTRANGLTPPAKLAEILDEITTGEKIAEGGQS